MRPVFKTSDAIFAYYAVSLYGAQYWAQQDRELAQKVLFTAQRLREAPGRPVRISRHAIGEEIQQSHLLYSKLDKLPLTSKVLEEVLETREAVAVRKLWWEAEHFLLGSLKPTRYQLLQKAGIGRHINKPLVKEAIEAVCSRLAL